MEANDRRSTSSAPPRATVAWTQGGTTTPWQSAPRIIRLRAEQKALEKAPHGSAQTALARGTTHGAPCSAVSAGTGKAAAASQLAPGGLRASSPAGAISRGAQVPWSRSGTGWVMTASPGAQPTAWPAASTVPAAATPRAIGGLAPASTAGEDELIPVGHAGCPSPRAAPRPRPAAAARPPRSSQPGRPAGECPLPASPRLQLAGHAGHRDLPGNQVEGIGTGRLAGGQSASRMGNCSNVPGAK